MSKKSVAISLLSALAALSAVPAASEAAPRLQAAPLTVSPGGVRRVAAIEARCPTFSWGAVPDAVSYELAVYVLRAASGETQLVLSTSLPGSASSWTPELGLCLERGGRYGWSVRALGREGATDWSPPALFRVLAGPTQLELERALAVVRTYLERRGASATRPREPAVGGRYSAAPAPGEAGETPGAAALGGADFSVDASGNVAGVSFSGDGAGLTGLDASNIEAGTLGIGHGGTGAATAEAARSALGAAPHADYVAHAGATAAHHAPTIDTTCNGAACDGSNFTNLSWESLTGVPAGLEDGDDDTTYTAGPGLELDGTQLRLTPDPGPVDNLFSTVDSGEGRGKHTSIVLGMDGLPVVSYYDSTLGELKVAKCNDPACDSAVNGAETVSTVDSTGDVGQYTSIALGADGLPVVSYYDVTNGDLKVAKCNDVACDPAVNGVESLTTVDSGADVGKGTSIALGADGLPIVSYQDVTNESLKVAKCNDPACDPAVSGVETLSVVDGGGAVGVGTSIAVGADGLPVVSYHDEETADLKVAKCNDPACSGGNETLSTVDSDGDVGRDSSLAIGADGLPVITYFGNRYLDVTNGALKVAKCNDPACSGGNETISTVDSNKGVGTSPSIALGADSLPVVSYLDSYSFNLKVAKCNDPACSSATLSSLDTGGHAGGHASIALGADGLPVISYWHFGFVDDADALKVARCGSAYCSSFALAAHDHDGRYYTEVELETPGSSAVHWDNLTGVPSGFADEVDDTCHLEECDGTNFNNLQWPNVVNKPAGFADNTDNTCDGAACDGSNFTNLQWSNVVNAPGGFRVTEDGVLITAPTDSPGVCTAELMGARYFSASRKELCYCAGELGIWRQVDGGGFC